MGLFGFIKHAWNTLIGYDPSDNRGNDASGIRYVDFGTSFYSRPDKVVIRGNEKTVVGAIYNRFAMDVASLNYKHIRTDENGKYIETLKTDLNRCLTINANEDQTARAFIKDVVLTALNNGDAYICPIIIDEKPRNNNLYDIQTMRIGTKVEEYPYHVKVRVYDIRRGEMVERVFPKNMVAVVENPLYAILNQPGSLAYRIIRKLSLMDMVDEQSGSGKLDLVVQLPYALKGKYLEEKAEQRKKDINKQLQDSKYGVAFVDATEKITQLNRPVENNLAKSYEILTSMLYSQLYINPTVLDGTATEQTMKNYFGQTIIPFAEAITESMTWKFVSELARSRGQKIEYFQDPFKNVTTSAMADIADKFTRNEIMSSNEVRQKLGLLPVNDPKADELRNKNLNPTEGMSYANTNETSSEPPMMDFTNKTKPVDEMTFEELIAMKKS